MRTIANVFLLAGSLFLAVAASAQPSAEGSSGSSQQPMPGEQFSRLLQQAAQAYQAQDIEAWVEATEKLHELRPYNQDFMRHIVVGHAQLGNLSQAYDMMLKMQQQGLSEDWDAIDAVEPLREHQVYDHLSRLMSDAGKPFGEVSVWSELDPEHAMPEAMAYDPEGERFLIGTIREGEILASQDGETWQTVVSAATLPELLGVFDLAVDAAVRIDA